MSDFRFKRSLLVSFLCSVLSVLIPTSGILAQSQDVLSVHFELQSHDGEDSFEVPGALIVALMTVADGDVVRLSEFPVAPGVRSAVTLRSSRVYGPSSRIFLIEDGEKRPLPLSDRLFFHGEAADGSLLALSMDPSTGSLRGISYGESETFEIVEQSAGDRNRHAVRSAAIGIEDAQVACGNDTISSADLDNPLADFNRAHLQSSALRGVGGTRNAVIAVDTDNEFHFRRFNNNTSSATAWIADMFNTMNVLYERDLDLHLEQGTTYYRLDTDPSPTYDDDPWNVSGSPASSSHLSEFGSYWQANESSVNRVFALLLSGKSASTNSASGIAWLDGFCEYQSVGGGYSINQIFRSSGISVASSVRIVAHEVGHNLGSPHTHCYSPPVDACSTLGGGCHSGATQCPGGAGTLMSYCHLNGCGSNQLALHPTVEGYMNSLVTSHFPSCVTPLSSGPLHTDTFEGGGFDNWNFAS